MERVTSLSAPPIVGTLYLVPTVSYPWLSGNTAKPYPVFLPKHEDKEHLNFAWWHYHVDPRFLSPTDMKRAANWYSWGLDEDGFGVCQSVTLSRRANADEPRDPDGRLSHPPVIWRARKCHRAFVPYMHGGKRSIEEMRSHFAGRICSRARSGWVCPHKHFPLGSVVPIDGVLTCPLHGLRVDAATGEVLAP